MNSVHADRHSLTAAGYLPAHRSANTWNCCSACAALTAVYTGRRSLAMASQSCRPAYRKVLRSRWITQVCTAASGQVVVIASGRPFSPSHTTMHTSATPRVFSSVSTASQYLAPSLPSPAQIPRMSRSPAVVTPMTT